MAIIKCKMCGGDLEFTPGATVGECEYCGTRQTLPKAGSEMVQNLFNRANNLRLKCEFDKAERIYEKILQENDGEAEAHWGIVLCKYGIEYVEDPKTLNRIPTCHRTSYDAVITDGDYLAALEHADAMQRRIYEAEAQRIDEIQKDILSIVKNEKPFDVFICYKETDEDGKRTPDSAIANDIYYQLTQEGLKVFYAAITLEDKLGQAYEPYIFAALSSAKVMLVIGTKPHYFTAVWVKNEWSRFLKLMKADRSKLLIPCYKGMDAYELPEEFAHLQAQDMTKIGFINDVVRGIRKVVGKDATAAVLPPVMAEAAPAAPATAALLDRAFLFLEDGNWVTANDYCEKVLDADPRNAQAYLGKLLIDLKVPKPEELSHQDQPFDGNANFQKALRFGDEALQATLNGYIQQIKDRNTEKALAAAFAAALALMEQGKFEEAIPAFEALNGYGDSTEMAARCRENAETARKNLILANAKAKMTGSKIKNYDEAIALLATIPGWQNADALRDDCARKIVELKEAAEAARLEAERQAEIRRQEAEERAQRAKKAVAIVLPVTCLLMALVLLINCVIIPMIGYNKAVKLMDAGQYSDAISAFQKLDGWKDSQQKINDCSDLIAKDNQYNDAVALMNSGELNGALALFLNLGDYRDSPQLAANCQTLIDMAVKYETACAYMEEGKYDAAITLFTELGDYKDSADRLAQCQAAINDVKYDAALALMDQEKYEEAIAAFEALNGYSDSVEKIAECQQLIKNAAKYQEALALMEAGKYAEAITAFEMIADYKDSKAKSEKCLRELEKIDAAAAAEAARKAKYNAGVALMEQGKYEQAIETFKALNGYKDSKAKITQCENAIKDGKYNAAVALMNAGKYEEAIAAFRALNGYKDSAAKITACENAIKDQTYNEAVVLMNSGNYAEAFVKFQSISGYKDSAAKASECSAQISAEDQYQKAVALMNQGKYEQAITAFKALNGYKDSAAKITACENAIKDVKYDAAVTLMNEGKYEQAITAFQALNGYKDSVEKITACKNEQAYQIADALAKQGQKAKAAMAFGKLSSYKDAKARSFALWDEIAHRETISAGWIHTVGLKADGTVVAVGLNEDGQCNVNGWTDIVAVSAGDRHTVGLKADGTVVIAGAVYSNVSEWTDIVAISAGIYHTVGLKADGTVVAVGDNDNGRCDVTGWRDIVAISAGAAHTVGLKADGTVVAAGRNEDGQCDVTGWRDIVAISVGDNHTVGLKADGTVVAVGDNYFGECNVTSWRDIVAIGAGMSRSIGVKADGTVVDTSSVGYSGADLTNIVAVSGGGWSTVGLKSDGTVVAVGSNNYGECDVTGWTNIKLPNKK